MLMKFQAEKELLGLKGMEKLAKGCIFSGIREHNPTTIAISDLHGRELVMKVCKGYVCGYDKELCELQK